MVVLGAGTGLRQGEAVGVELDQVDFLRRQLVVRQQLVVLAREQPKIAPPKTDGSYRTVPLPRIVLNALAAHLAEFPPVPVEVEDTTGPQPVRRPARLLFTTPEGRPLRRTSFSAMVWQPARTRAGLPDSVTFHDLRHYYASLLIRHNENVKVVQAGLGTPRPPRRWTPTRTCGRTPRIGPGLRSMRCLERTLLRAACGQGMPRDLERAGQAVCDGRVGLYAGFCGRGALRHCPGRRPSI